jgi:hypothetical protein
MVLATGVGDGFQGYGLLAGHVLHGATVRRATPPPCVASIHYFLSVYVMKKLRC